MTNLGEETKCCGLLLDKASFSQIIKAMCMSCRAPKHNVLLQLIGFGGVGLLGSPRGVRDRVSNSSSTPPEEWCGMKSENASEMPTWELLTPDCCQGDLGEKHNLSLPCWKLLVLSGVITESLLGPVASSGRWFCDVILLLQEMPLRDNKEPVINKYISALFCPFHPSPFC